MSKFQQKAEAHTKQTIGQMPGDELLVQEGKEPQREAPDPERSIGGHDQGIVRDERGQEAPRQGARPAREQGGSRR